VRTILLLALALGAASPVAAGEPVVAVWYRGNPAGTPRQGDLGVIRALGFNGVTWPRASNARTGELQKMADAVGLKLILVDRPAPSTPESMMTPGERVDIVVTRDNVSMLPALAWRAVAHGARTISFDAGEPAGAGLEEPNGALRPWTREAIALARQLTGNARLVNVLTQGPGVIASATPGFDVVLLDGVRSWVIVATNTSNASIATSVRLPSGAPYAMWISWIDGGTLAMADEPPGPRWNLQIAAGAARVYLIDKIIKAPGRARPPGVSAGNHLHTLLGHSFLDTPGH
jgi:hypothetical protein